MTFAEALDAAQDMPRPVVLTLRDGEDEIASVTIAPDGSLSGRSMSA